MPEIRSSLVIELDNFSKQAGIQVSFARTGYCPESLTDSPAIGMADIVAAAERAMRRKSG